MYSTSEENGGKRIADPREEVENFMQVDGQGDDDSGEEEDVSDDNDDIDDDDEDYEPGGSGTGGERDGLPYHVITVSRDLS